VEQLWLDEALQRAAEIDAGEIELICGEEVDRKASALLRSSTACLRWWNRGVKDSRRPR